MSKKKRELPEENQLEGIATGLKNILEEELLSPMWFLHTGNLALDYVISGKVDGTGGYPVGTCELYGDPSSGKSLLLAKAIAEMQKLGELTVLADAELRWDSAFATLHGVDDSKLYKFYPETVEDFAIKVVKILDSLEESNKKVLIVLDSLAILSTIKEQEDVEGGDIKADQGRKAQKIKAAFRAIRGKIRKTGSILLISNHVIASPGTYVPTRTTPGGGGSPFQANVRIELRKPTQLTIAGKDRPIGVELRALVTKNSIAPPFGECSMQLHWSTGVSKYSGLLDLALDLGIIERKGAWNRYGEVSFQTSNFEEVIRENPEILTDPKWSHPYFLEAA
jgi:recombination protein RecA